MVVAWRALDEQVRRCVARTVYGASVEDIEDCSQSALAVLVKRKFPEGVKDKEAYIMAVVKSIVIAEGRKQARRKSLHAQMAARWSEETVLTIEELGAEMWSLISYLRQALPPDYFVILFGGFVYDMSNQELADKLKVPLRTLERRQRDARIVAQTARGMMRLGKCAM